jgi:hypothetical protein
LAVRDMLMDAFFHLLSFTYKIQVQGLFHFTVIVVP